MKKRALLFIHGIAGNPNVFDFLKASLPFGEEAFFLVLKGHGEDGRNFGRCSYPLWREQVKTMVESLLERYDRLVLVGHSMGCLLSLEMAVLFPERIEFLFLLCPPLRIRVRLLPMLKNVFYAFAGERRISDPDILAARRCCGVPVRRNPFSYIPWARPFLSLLVHVPKVRRLLPGVTVPIHAFHCRRDELVSQRSARDLALPVARNVLLADSGHYLFAEADAKRVRDSLLARLADGSPSADSSGQRQSDRL